MISYQNIYEQLHHITDYVQNIRLPHTYPIQPYLQTIHDNRLYLAITVSGVTFLTTLLIMGKWRRMTRSIRSIVLRTSSSRSEKYNQIRTEIMESEERHVDVLEYIQSMFYKPLEREGLLTPDQLANVFSNTKQVLEIHRQVLQGLQSSKKPFEKTIYAIFSGPLGTQMEQEVGLFCTKHKLKGMSTWVAHKNDNRIRELLNPEPILEANPDCTLAKLTLDDHLSAVFQRPLRYPLLLERLLGECRPDSPEGRLIAKTLARSRDIGFNINEQLRRAERLIEIDQKTDRAAGLHLDLVDHNLVREDRLTWRVSKSKMLDVLLVLTDRVVAILRRESNGRFTYKNHKLHANSLIGGAGDVKDRVQSMIGGGNSNVGGGGGAKGKTRHSPLVYLSGDLITKTVATDTNAFFMISTEQDVLYEFVAPTLNERNLWMECINKATKQAGNHPGRSSTSAAPAKPARAPVDGSVGDVVDDEQGEPEEFKRSTGARKSWFDSLTRRKGKANKQKTSNGVKESAL